jgi:hypothetical protein
MSSGLVQRDRVLGGIRLGAAPGATAALLDLIELERECCAWIRFDVGDGSAVIMTAEGFSDCLIVMYVREGDLRPTAFSARPLRVSTPLDGLIA